MATELEILELIILIIAISIDYLIGILMLKRTLNAELRATRRYFGGATGFFFIHATCRLFYMLQSLFFREQIVLYNIATILGLASLTVFLFAIESTILPKARHVFSIYGFIGIITMIILIGDTTRYMGLRPMIWVQYFTVPVLGAVITLIYFTHIFKSTESVRNHFILMTISILLLEISELGNSYLAHQLFPWSDFAAPIIMLVGLILIYVAIIKYYKIDAN